MVVVVLKQHPAGTIADQLAYSNDPGKEGIINVEDWEKKLYVNFSWGYSVTVLWCLGHRLT